jgi:hypothetical protein
MRWVVLTLVMALAGCTEAVVSGVAPTAGDAAEGAQQAYFPAYPSNLFVAAAAICDGPAQTVVQPSRNEVRCESFPDTESAAALILQFNGSVQALPKFIIAFTGRDTSLGYLVTADNYIRVPQRSGGAQQVRFPDLSVSNELRALLRAAGGQPL